jgi:hypothetical protein
MSMSLYEINQAILSLVDEETGEIADWNAFDALQMARETKLENVACWYKNLTVEAAAIRQEEINLAERRKKLERKSESLKKYLAEALAGEKFETARCAVNFRKTTKVEISDAQHVAEWLENHGHHDLVVYSMPTVSKTELTKLLKTGEIVPGAELVDGLSLSVK